MPPPAHARVSAGCSRLPLLGVAGTGEFYQDGDGSDGTDGDDDDHFTTWCRLDFDGDWRRRLIVMLRAYFDLGATFDRQASPEKPAIVGVISMGGYLARADEWIRFGRRWRKILREHGVKVFHMTDFERGGPPYEWDKSKREKFIVRLLKILGETARLGTATAIVRRDLDSLSAEEYRRFGNVYRYCAVTSMEHICRWLDEQGVEDSGDYIFEFGDDGQGPFRAMINEVIYRRDFRERFRVKSVYFKTKLQATGLQTGDIAAYEACKHVPRVMGEDSRAIRKSLEALLKKVPHRGGFLTLPEIRQYIAMTKSLPSTTHAFNNPVRARKVRP